MLLIIAIFALLATPVNAAEEPNVTRAEVAMFLFNNSGQAAPPARGERRVFVDVPAGSWQERYLRAAVQKHMIEPDERTGAVLPNTPVSRGEYLWMLAMLYKLPPRSPHHFIDVPTKVPYTPYANHAELCQIFPLTEKTRLEPNHLLTPTEVSLALFALWRCYPSLKPGTNLGEAALMSSSSAPAILQPILPSPNKTEQKRLQIIALVNQERKASGLPPLMRNTALDQTAQAHAKDMYVRGYFSHYSPEGLSYIDRIRKSGYLTLPPALCPCKAIFDLNGLLQERTETKPHYVITQRNAVCNCTPRFALGENIARGQQTADIAVLQWMASESHRQTILQPLFRETGIGIVGDVWVQEFGALALE